MPAETPPAKICTICRHDCSRKPRVKDVQGNYTCRACLQGRGPVSAGAPAPSPSSPPSAATRAVAPTPPPVARKAMPNDNLVQQILGDPSKRAYCTSCGQPMVAGAVICTHCGTNHQTGKPIRTRVKKAEKEKKDPAAKGRGASRAMGNTMGLLTDSILIPVIALVIVGGLFFGAVSTDSSEMALMAVIGYWAFALTVYIAVVVSAFRTSAGWGIGCLLCGIIQLVYIVMENDSPALRSGWVVSFILGIIARFVLEPHFAAM